MASPESNRALRAARCEFAKRGIEMGRASVQMRHGILHITGTIGIIRGAQISNLEAEVEHAGKALRQKPEIRDVIIECHYHGSM